MVNAPWWTTADEQLADQAAEIISNDGWVQELTRAVGKPSDYTGNGRAFIMSMSVKGDHPGKPRVRSNWLGTKKRPRSAGSIALGVSLPATKSDGSGPGVYRTAQDAVKDKLRFAFWAKMRCPDLDALLDILIERHPERFAAYESAVLAYRAAREEETLFEIGRNPLEDAAIRASTAFHLAFPVHSIEEAKAFYGEEGVLGGIEGRSTSRWVDYNFWGAQLVCHLVDGYDAGNNHNSVDGDPVPVPHFGLAMTIDAFEALAKRVKENGWPFQIAPHLRFEGKPGEQRVFFIKDPSGNALEFKAMTTPENLFARYSA